MSDELLCEVQEGIALLTLNRPQARNALSPELADLLLARVNEIRADDAVRAVVITGAGGAFCAGGDVTKMANGPRTGEQRLAAMRRYSDLTRALMTLHKPVVAAVDGVAFGAGFSIALTADLVLLSDRARLCMVFQRIGLLPDMGALYTLPRAVGLQRARELILSAREVRAEEALRIGLALEVVSPDALLPRALQLARSLAGASPIAVQLGKELLGRSLHSDFDSMMEGECAAQSIATGSAYLEEAARRFRAKEPPQFTWPEKT